MEKLPFVSICLLTYKRADILSRSIDSLLAQSHPDFELIINDDNSPDHTERVCREYERRDKRVKYCKNAANLRYAGNQNAALARANSDYVAIVHDGDIYRSDLIEKWTRAMVAYPTAALVFNGLEAMDLEGRITNVFLSPYPPLIEGRKLATEMIQRPDSPIFGIVMVRKSCVQKVGLFDLRLPTLADVDMWLRLLGEFDAAYINEPLLRISARELDHHNQVGNWGVQAQYELIYVLALNRLFLGDPDGMRVMGRRVGKFLWRARFMAIFACLKRGKIKAFLKGLRFCLSSPLTVAKGE